MDGKAAGLGDDTRTTVDLLRRQNIRLAQIVPVVKGVNSQSNFHFLLPLWKLLWEFANMHFFENRALSGIDKPYQTQYNHASKGFEADK